MTSIYLTSALLIIFNILDSVTTHIALYRLPDELKAKESNPLMAKLFIKNYKVAQLLKHAIVLALVIYAITSRDLYSLELMATMLGLVVLNNTYILAGRRITHKRIESPVRKLQRLLHVPDKLHFVLVIIIIFGLSILIINSF